MGQTTHQIEAHIADTREKLGNNPTQAIERQYLERLLDIQ